MSDVEITIIDREGEEHKIQAPTDMSMTLMETVKAFELVKEGTFGICGGLLMCSTCHCYVENDVEVPPMDKDEESLLHSEARNVKPNSRLTCQIPVTEKLAGLKIRIAPEE